jgi:hypothetical protein
MYRLRALEKGIAPVMRPIRDTDGHPLAVAALVAGADPTSVAVAERLAIRLWGVPDSESALAWLADAAETIATPRACSVDEFADNVRQLAELSIGQWYAEGVRIAGGGR